MVSFSSRQWIAVAGGIVLFTSLFFINRKAPASKDDNQAKAGGHVTQAESFDSILAQAEAQVPTPLKTKIEDISKSLSSAASKDQETTLNTIVNLYDSAGAHIPATYYTEKLAAMQNSSDMWFQAGDRYYKSAGILTSSARVTVLKRAEDCFNNALKIDSTYTDAKTGLAECIVQGENPMQGIKMLEGILQKDSNNEKAQIALGEFSIQSGQLPKAIYRFNRVLKIDPTYIEGYLYLAEAYENSGDKKTAVSYLKKYSTFAKDSAVKVQVDNYIKKLENDTLTGKNK